MKTIQLQKRKLHFYSIGMTMDEMAVLHSLANAQILCKSCTVATVQYAGITWSVQDVALVWFVLQKLRAYKLMKLHRWSIHSL